MRRPARRRAERGVLIALGLPFLGVKFTSVDATVLPKDSPARVVDTALRAEFPPGRTTPVVVAAHTLTRPRQFSAAAALRRRCGGGGAAARRGPRPLANRRVHRGLRPIREEPGGRAEDPRPARALRRRGGRPHRRVRGPEVEPRRPHAGRARLACHHDVRGAVPVHRLGDAAAEGAADERAHDQRGVRPAGVRLPGRAARGLLGYASQGALESSQPVVLFAVAFGLSTDYGVFLLSRIKEARDSGVPNRRRWPSASSAPADRDRRRAPLLRRDRRVRHLADHLHQGGRGRHALAVLIDATLVRALLVPSLMELLGRWNWWAPRPLRRLHARFGLDEGAGHGVADVARPG